MFDRRQKAKAANDVPAEAATGGEGGHVLAGRGGGGVTSLR